MTIALEEDDGFPALLEEPSGIIFEALGSGTLPPPPAKRTGEFLKTTVLGATVLLLLLSAISA
jgi:hypothetical protein